MTCKIRFAVFSKNNISGSTGSKKSLETGKYFLNQGSACCEYFTDALSILVFFYRCQCFVYTRADNNVFHHVPLIMLRHELSRSLRYLFISGSTGSKKLLEMGKYSIT